MTASQVLFWIFAAMTCGAAIAVVISQSVVRMAFWLIVSLGSAAGLFFLLHADFVAATQLLVYVGGTLVVLVFGLMLTASAPFMRIRTSPAEAFLATGIGALFLVLVVSTVGAVNWHHAALRITELDQVPSERFEAVRGEKTDEEAALLEAWYRSDEERDAYRLQERVAGERLSHETMLALARLWDAEERIAGAPQLEAAEATTARPLGLGFLGLRPDKDLGRPETDELGRPTRLTPGYLLPFEIVSVHLLVVLIGAAYLARAKRRPERQE